MPRIIPIKDLKNTALISQMCNESAEPIYVTKNGYGDMVIMSLKAYESILETAATDRAISEAEAEFAADGQLHDARSSLSALRRKHLGG